MLKGRQAGASPGRTREGSVLVGPPGKATESAGHGSGQASGPAAREQGTREAAAGPAPEAGVALGRDWKLG